MGCETGQIEMADDIVMYGDVLAERVPDDDNDLLTYWLIEYLLMIMILDPLEMEGWSEQM